MDDKSMDHKNANHKSTEIKGMDHHKTDNHKKDSDTGVTLCGSSSYNRKYYLNPAFDKLPKMIRDELQIMCVEFTEEVGGVLTLEFNPSGELEFKVLSAEGDQRFDEIGSALRIKKIREEKQEILQELTLYYRVIVRGEKA